MDLPEPLPPPKRFKRSAYFWMAVPFFALSFGVCFANHDEPVFFGLPFLLSYLIFWVVMTPLFLWIANRSVK